MIVDLLGCVNVRNLPIHGWSLVAASQLLRRVGIVVAQEVLILKGCWQVASARLWTTSLQGLSIVVAIRLFIGQVTRLFRYIISLESLFTAISPETHDIATNIRVEITMVFAVSAVYLLDSFLSIDVIIAVTVIV